MGVLNNTSKILGKKIGMTQVFGEDGKVKPVTVIEAGPCVILGLNEKNIKVGFGDTKESKVKKPQIGEFKKLNLPVKRYVRELRVLAKENYKVGDEIKVDIFQEGDFVDVSGVSIGKGFQGGMKRWHWMGTPQTHGSMSHRRVGSIGASSDPSRVFKGKTMAGHMGHDKITVQNLKVVKVDLANNILVVLGAVPGHKESLLEIRKAIKKQKKA
ncbi:MAG: 50S ribosomal protein L3 [Candidatus Omnitrophica bacterium]|nr:50S ribosomal protein L3 [Candidatus Omnitrophota bacterium]MDD5574314.1 50S ribosomal protein L3 [Candidatus Omnitrophota bacterium]